MVGYLNLRMQKFTQAKILAQTFSNFFTEKIAKIRTAVSNLENSVNDLRWPATQSPYIKITKFNPSTQSEIITLSQNYPQQRASWTQFPLLSSVPCLGPVIFDTFNEVLRTGIFPRESKSATVVRLLKKWGLDRDVFTV